MRTNLWLLNGAPMPMATVRCQGSVADFFADRDCTYELNEFDSSR